MNKKQYNKKKILNTGRCVSIFFYVVLLPLVQTYVPF